MNPHGMDCQCAEHVKLFFTEEDFGGLSREFWFPEVLKTANDKVAPLLSRLQEAEEALLDLEMFLTMNPGDPEQLVLSAIGMIRDARASLERHKAQGDRN